jgi:2'-5' RNA ligase
MLDGLVGVTSVFREVCFAMGFAVILLVSEPQREVFYDVFRAAKTDMLAKGMPPHISLAVFDEVEVTQLDRVVERFSQDTNPLDVWMSSIGMFPTEQPYALMLPTVTATLLETHRRFHQEMGELAENCWGYYKPDHWSPHLTLGSADSLASALEIISVAYESKLTGQYLFDEVSLIEWHPVKTISSYKLSFAKGTGDRETKDC